LYGMAVKRINEEVDVLSRTEGQEGRGRRAIQNIDLGNSSGAVARSLVLRRCLQPFLGLERSSHELPLMQGEERERGHKEKSIMNDLPW
jgi:hypothetical protein